MSHVSQCVPSIVLLHHITSLVPFDATTKQLMPAPVLEAVMDITHDWMMFGTYLGIPYHKLKAIREPKPGECMLATLNKWIALKPQEATIHNLLHAVGGPLIGNKSLVQQIENDPKIKEMYGLGDGNSTGGFVIVYIY